MEETKKIKRKLILSVPVLVFALLLAGAAAYAWFSQTKELQTAAQIAEPNPISIKAGGQSEPLEVNIPAIDLRQAGASRFVFCVLSNDSEYNLVLAYTTNLPLSYSVCKVTSIEPGPAYTAGNFGEYRNFHYLYNTPLAGTYLNKTADKNTAISTGKYHNATYAAEDDVQINAEPIYWTVSVDYDRSAPNPEPPVSGLYAYIDYYVLVATWEPTANINNYNKETDMVYIMAGS